MTNSDSTGSSSVIEADADVGELETRANNASYETWVRANAATAGFTVVKERGGLSLCAADGSWAWHRLGGLAEEAYDFRMRLEAGEDSEIDEVEEASDALL